MSEGVIVALIGLASSATGGVITYLVVRRKNEADVADTITDTALSLIEPLKERISSLEAEVTQLKRKTGAYLARIVYLMDGIGKLSCQIKELKNDPCWKPDEWKPE